MKRKIRRTTATGKRNDLETIWLAGRKISHGYGFWGSSELFRNVNPKEIVRAWIDGLRQRGYRDDLIALYGDWTDGRAIAGAITPKMTYKQFREIVVKNARAVEEVAEEYVRNVDGKDDMAEVRTWLR